MDLPYGGAHFAVGKAFSEFEGAESRRSTAVITHLVRNCALERVIQYSRGGGD